MKIYYDLHLHTALSPCGDLNMTPNNIINLSILLGLDVIAITDHNSYLNIKSCMEVGKNKDIIIIPGIEVETSEEIHVICLFDNLNDCEKFGKIIEENLIRIKNNEKIFGQQLILDKLDNEVGIYENLLISPTKFTINEIVSLTKKFNGLGIPAHIDRPSNSIISNLGIIPEELEINLVEITHNSNPEEFLQKLKKYSSKEYNYIISSDAHYLEHMKEAKYYLEFEKKPSAKEFLDKLKRK